MSAALMPFCAEVRFCTWLLMTADAAFNRLTPAPMTPRIAATEVMAELISIRAACAFVALVRSVVRPRPPVPDEDKMPTEMPMVLDEFASDRKIEVVAAVNT